MAAPTLKRTLGVWDLTSIGIGGVVGAGIFVLTGVAAAEYAGPAIILSFAISGVGCGFSALCYAELSSMVPVAGSAYAFASATLGELPGFMIGWDLMLEYLFGAAAVAVGWSSYVRSGLRDVGGVVPRGLAGAPVAFDIKAEAWVATDGGVDALAILVVLLTSAVQVRGIGESARFNTVLVVLKLVVLLIFICAGAGYIQPSNYDPFVPPATDKFGVYGWSGVLRGSSVVFFSFIGFDALSTNAGEAVDPQRTVPLATLLCLGISTALYVATAAVMTGMAKYTTLGVADPIAVAVDAAGPGLYWLRPVVKLGAVLGLTSVVMVQILGQARVFWALAEDGMLPAVFARVHPKYRTPYVTTTFTAVVASLIAGLLPIDVLGEMVSIGTLFAFALVCAGVIVLRRTQPDLPRPFRTPCSPWVPLLGVFTSVGQMVALPAGTWLRFILWLLLGLCVYYGYSRRHAKPYALRRAALLGLTLDGRVDPARHASLSSTVCVVNALHVGAPVPGGDVHRGSARAASGGRAGGHDLGDAYAATACPSTGKTGRVMTPRAEEGAGGRGRDTPSVRVDDWAAGPVPYDAVNLAHATPSSPPRAGEDEEGEADTARLSRGASSTAASGAPLHVGADTRTHTAAGAGVRAGAGVGAAASGGAENRQARVAAQLVQRRDDG